MDDFVNYLFMKFTNERLKSWAKERYFFSEKRAEEEVNDAYVKFYEFLQRGENEKALELQTIYEFEPEINIIFDVIKNFTLKPPNTYKLNELIQLLGMIGVAIDIDETGISFKGAGVNFSVLRFSEQEPSIKNILSDIESESRGGRCHPYSVLTAIEYDKRKDIETYLVTGKIYHLSKKFKYLHSWVEVSDEKNTFVVDASKNVLMDKAAYYAINHVGETERVPSRVVVEDFDMIKALTDYDNYVVKVYYENAQNGRMLYDILKKKKEIMPDEPHND